MKKKKRKGKGGITGRGKNEGGPIDHQMLGS